ncbi:PL29 family lyase N-terminal domain-containing protein [Alistipes sp.]|uniref:PL29 family lyase N-terminal domain-containing protein n=1 Tax=Alistipes sp. TaxID=1872444 RepID=UPI003AEFCA76
MKKFLIMSFAALAAVFQSCENHDDLWDAIDDLNGRVEAMETQVKALNDNIAALQRLYSGATIKDVAKQGDKWLITLSDGQQITLTEGSVAEAIVPIMGITDDGYWQYSTDGGTTWTRLDVKAAATDGKTPQFRVDEATGYWQVSYDNVKWDNVTDKSGQPVKAVGEGQVTDEFFADVKVEDGMFCITLKDPAATQLRIPILSDFFCRIVLPAAGVQAFAAGETKSFAVEIRGVESDQTSVSAPDGWSARLTEPADEKAELIVTAPAAAAKSTRAVADNSKDVSILCIVGGYASITKMQVEVSAPADAPTVTVANSATVAPTASALTFDVTATDADGWKYICQQASLAAPDADKIMADGTAGSGTGVTVEGLEAATEYAIYVVAYAGEVKSEVQSARNTTAALPVIAADYYQDYLDGKTIQIGTLAVNKELYPTAQMLKPSELTVDHLQAGGLIFFDNSDEKNLTQTLAVANVNLGRDADIVLIGRYPDKKQVSLSIPEMRCNNHVAIKNIRLIGVTTNTFVTSNAKKNPDLLLVDCTLEINRYFLYDNNSNYSFDHVLIDNSVVKYPAGMTNQPLIYGITTTAKAGGYTQRSIKVTNSILYCEQPLQAHIVNVGNTAQYNATDLVIEVTGNTFYNIYQPNVLIRAGVAKGLIATGNVGYVDYQSLTVNPTYLACVYFASADAGVSSVADNYFYSVGKAAATKDKLPWVLLHSNNKVSFTGESTIVDGDETPSGYPFTSADAAAAYFPIDRSVVTNGAGADYTTKKWER